MANSIITETGDGSTVQYALNFTLGILSREYVTCRVGDEVDGLGDPVYRDLEWVTDGLVNIQGAAPGNDVPIVFKRTMPKDVLIHDYSDGVPIQESNLDESNLQTMMSIHEFLDGRIEGGFLADLDMNGYRIINLGDGVADSDAGTMEQLNNVGEFADAAEEAAEDAIAALAAVESIQDVSQDWATKTTGVVASSEYSSKAYAIGGTGITSTATKGAAKEWATTTGAAVDTAEYSAKEYALGTTVSAGSAKSWATKAEDSAVTGGLFSALHYAAKAALSATAAATSAALFDTVGVITSSSNAITCNLATHRVFSHTLTENTTFTFSNPPASGTRCAFEVHLFQHATAKTITWPASITKWSNGVEPTLTTNSAKYMLAFYTIDGGTTYVGTLCSEAFA